MGEIAVDQDEWKQSFWFLSLDRSCCNCSVKQAYNTFYSARINRYTKKQLPERFRWIQLVTDLRKFAATLLLYTFDFSLN